MTTTIEFKCPKCAARPHEHGRGGEDACRSRIMSSCEGLICECEVEDDFGDSALDDHGQVFTNPCRNAVCYHCGWHGTVPVKPKGLQTWEKKALEAGWCPPRKRRLELGLPVQPAEDAEVN